MSMPNLAESEVVARSRYIRQMLRPLASSTHAPTVRPFSTQGAIVLGASQGKSRGQEYRSWRFLTRAARIRASYHELWRETKTSSEYSLVQMYLALYEVDQVRDQEHKLLALHSDPEMVADSAENKYKRGPHLHVMSVPEGFHRAHLALELSSLDTILDSCAALSKSMTQLVVMLSDEVLQRVKL